VHVLIPETDPENDKITGKLLILDLTEGESQGLIILKTIDISGLPDGIYLLEIRHTTDINVLPENCDFALTRHCCSIYQPRYDK